MSDAFRERARNAISDLKLQTALDQNAERRMSAWGQTFGSLLEPHRLRQRAHQVRQIVIQDLDRTLARFARQVEANGIHVHRAANAEEAVRIVLSIARRHNAKLIAKSKSMVSEEVGLNDALTQAGIRVVETDLGEFIVQLRDEPPAHIVTPAVHLLREDVAATFSRQLGMPYSEDVEDMNAAARNVLREVFLTAQVGVSGVNFGIAENGLLCLVTNEGNGRMVTTVPEVHIALMGMERIVPTMEDLDLMLKLLPRSATGQKISSYVTLIRGPRHESDPDGPEERHLVLVDNGRLSLATSSLSEALLCIRCGACLNVCPVYREIGGHSYDSVYPGPIGSVISPSLFGIEEYGHLATATTLCGACLEVCPVQIDLPILLLRTRQSYRASSPQPRLMRWLMAFYTWAMESPSRYRMAQRIAVWATRLMPRRRGWVQYLPPPLSAWTAWRHFPPFASSPFRERFDDLPFDVGTPSPPERSRVRARSVGDTSPLQDVIVRFGKELESLGGVFIRCEERRAANVVAAQLRKLGARTVVAWGEGEMISPSILQRLRDEGFVLEDPELPRANGALRQSYLAEIESVDAGLTGSIAGIAETGTLVLPSGSNRSQLASLLPPIHIALLPVEALYFSFDDWLNAEGRQWIEHSSCLTLVSGPSRTADIEMTLTIGVHGPGTLIVVCYD